MKSVTFPQANTVFGPPPGMDESQCGSVVAFKGAIFGGNNDGTQVTVVAWEPSPEDIQRILLGGPIFMVCLGGLPPHTLATEFPELV